MLVCREEHPDLVESMTKKGSNIPEKPKTPQQLWYNHEKKAFLKTRPDVGQNHQHWRQRHNLTRCTQAAPIPFVSRQATTKDIKDSLGKQWTQLSDKKRLKWITKSLEQRKVYEVRLSPFLPARFPTVGISMFNASFIPLFDPPRR